MTEDHTTPAAGITPSHDTWAPDATQTMEPDTTQTLEPDTTQTTWAPEATQTTWAPEATQTIAPDTMPASRPDTTPATAGDPGQSSAEVTAEDAGTESTRPWFKRKRIAFPSAVLLTFLVLMVSTGGNDPGIIDRTRTAAELKADLARSRMTGAIGESVRDGKFAFMVTTLELPGRTVTNRLGTADNAQGDFVIVRVNVSNIGYDPRALTPTNQYLINDKGQRFATSAASLTLPVAERIFVGKVNPGHSVSDAPFLFDVPHGTRIVSIELHDSVSSPGVKIKLS